MFDGFISYSHAADDLLAPRLQAGLQRFAKPWWKRRALRLFRDEASLSANPHLWSSITDALDESEWFVLLLSPDAAESPWVDREVEYWLEHKDPDRIIPVLTEGEFGWENGDITSDAAPPALKRAFSDEPRWVDLRFARSDEQLDLKNPQFSGSVADIASALRGIPKDELESEEVKQHRRTIRTAWVAGLALLALASAAVVFGVRADQQALLAEANAQLAQANAAAEAEARQESEAQRAIAQQNEERALRSEAIAINQALTTEARRLIAASNDVLDEDPEESVLLVLQAIAIAPDDLIAINTEAVAALSTALVTNRLMGRFEVPVGVGNFAVISPDGDTIYQIVQTTGLISAVDVETGEQVWSRDLGSIPDPDLLVAISPDGTELVVTLPGVEKDDELRMRLLVVSSGDGSVIYEIEPGDCHLGFTWGSGFSPDGRYFSMLSGTSGCLESADGSWSTVYDTDTWTEQVRIRVSPVGESPAAQDLFAGPGTFDGALFSEDSRMVLVNGFRGFTDLRTFPELDLIQRFGTNNPVAFDPGGERMVFVPVDPDRLEKLSDPLLVDPRSGVQLAVLRLDGQLPQSVDDPMSFSADGEKIAIVTADYDYVFRSEFGERFLRLPDTGQTVQHSWTADGTRLLTVSVEGWLLLWDVADLPDVFQEGLMGLDLDGLVSFALDRLTRSFTIGECANHNIEPCPLELDQIFGS